MTPALVNKLKPHNQAFIDEQPLVFSKLKFRVLLAIFLTTCILGIVFGKLETLRQSFWLVAQPYVGKRKYFFWFSTPSSSGTISYKIFSPLQKIFGKFPPRIGHWSNSPRNLSLPHFQKCYVTHTL